MSSESFHFERTFALSEDRYVAVWSGLPLRTPKVLVGLALFLALSMACLFWRYTIALGIGLLLLWLLVFFATWMGGIAKGMSYRFYPHFSETRSYGASQEAFWLRSATVEGSVRWSRLWTWRETAGLLVLRAREMPPVYLPLEGLRRDGIYEAVLALARRHGEPARVFGIPAPAEWTPRQGRSKAAKDRGGER